MTVCGACAKIGRMSESVEASEPHPWHIGRLITAWAVAAVFGVMVLVFSPEESRFAWLVFAIGLGSLVTFALQLGTAQKHGFITRLAFSIAGCVLITAGVDGIGTLIGRI